MITEYGIVTQVDVKSAWVKTVRRSTCEGCGSKDSCEAAKTGHVEALNLVGAGLGDTVTVGFETGSLIKISMLLYIFPVLFMIGGAVLGTYLAPQYGMDESAAAALFAFGSFFISFVCIRLTSSRISGNARYQAKIIKIRGRAPVAEESSASVPCSNG
ncbi:MULTISPECIES: SoxR reducing system RseC family protein [Desulfococcus]|uniref:Positive regulator of sigma E, RseC/MucC n=1 Tax=Desulfococcus multivorans DSM 2059 TaxID=1121405 RepID=S7TKY7_DESML|nr:SoxR reducing system RseC family protein [Desulfococcus multivorans]AOY59629.1 positive regulator of sigma E, RseC/MucC [Desulfococcus multivorans]EPR37882.1 positive regulator of sigma E, RseC/MucC [Desulfococcus multivorans DSM 2059]MDX9817518.1 SoxR reducing system RseC family protein [Desulfococcus multivorans]SKA16191.1 positive regulator of sigma(E), RseC/MucC [Desulfococcus multivorans DSM 2059]